MNFFSKESKSEKKNCSLIEGVNVRKDWLVKVNLFYKDFVWGGVERRGDAE